MTEIVAAHLERVARELAAKIKAEHRCDEPTCWLDVQDENCLAGVLAAALAACAREEAEPLLKYAIHKNTCKGFPAFSEAQLALDCNCGLQAIKARLAALGEKS